MMRLAERQDLLALVLRQLSGRNARAVRDRLCDVRAVERPAAQRLHGAHLLAHEPLQLVAQHGRALKLAAGDRLIQLARQRQPLLFKQPPAAMLTLHKQDARRALVQQVQRLIRQEAVGDIAARQLDRRIHGLLADAEVVVLLQPGTQAHQHAFCLRARRLAHNDRPEAPLKRGVLFDVPPVFLQRRRADHLKLAAAKRGLEQICRVDSALGAPRADDGVHLVDK